MRAARCLRHLVLLCGLLPALLLQPASAKERIFWLVRDLPPFTILEGPEKGQGVIDQLLPLLIRQMPEYDHSIVRVNRARGIQMLQDLNSFTCDPTLLWTPERAEYVRFSVPSLGVLSGGLVLRKDSEALVAPYLDGQEVDLHGLLSKAPLKLGVVAERSYGTQIDAILRSCPTARSAATTATTPPPTCYRCNSSGACAWCSVTGPKCATWWSSKAGHWLTTGFILCKG